MWVEALRFCPSVGQPGATKDIDERSARVLMLLGYVTAAVKPEPPKPVKVDKPKRTYRRKDMVPEEPVEVVVVEVVPEPEPEPEPVEADPVDDDTDGEDEAAVRL